MVFVYHRFSNNPLQCCPITVHPTDRWVLAAKKTLRPSLMGRPSIGLTFRWKVPSTMCSYVICSCFGGRSLKLWKSQSIFSRTQGKHHHKLLGFAATGLHMGGFCLHSVIIPYQTSVLNKPPLKPNWSFWCSSSLPSTNLWFTFTSWHRKLS